MAWMFVLAMALGFPGKIYDNSGGVGAMLFITSLMIFVPEFENTANLPMDDTGYKIMALSLVMWPGVMWATAAGVLAFHADEFGPAHGSSWFPSSSRHLECTSCGSSFQIESPLRDWRVANALTGSGIVIGHLLSPSRTGRTVTYRYAALLPPFAAHPFHTMLVGGAMMVFAAARIMQSRSRAARDPQVAEKPPNNTLIPLKLPPGGGEQFYIAAWSVGLTFCVSSMLHSEARATLVFASIGLVLTMAVFPPFTGRGWLPFDNWLRLLLNLQGIVILSCWIHD